MSRAGTTSTKTPTSTSSATQPPSAKAPSTASKPPPAKPSLSASVILLAPLPERTADGYDYRVLLLKRDAKGSTYASAHVFPGGNIDPSDYSPEWSKVFPAPATYVQGDTVEERAIKICAARETFEECGVLLLDQAGNGNGGPPCRGVNVWRGVNDAERLQWRDKVHSNGQAFVDLFKFLSGPNPITPARPGISMLHAQTNWITPPILKRRFDTHFFFAVLPSHTVLPSSASSPLVTADGKETVSADWLTPAEAIRNTLLHSRLLALTTPENPFPRNDTPDEPMILFPPQFYALSELAGLKSLDDVVGKLAGGRKVVPFSPERKTLKDSNGEERIGMVLPGDAEHSASKKMGIKEGGHNIRHRTYVLPPMNGQQGLTVLGVVRKGLRAVLGAGWDDMSAGDVGGDATDRAKL